VTLDAGITPRWDRFGFSLEAGDAEQCVRYIVDSPYLDLGGLHAHIGTYILDPGAYARTATKLADFAMHVEGTLGARPTHLDLGGGFASTNTLASQYHSGSLVPRPAEYIREIGRALREQGAPQWPVYLETGRALVDECGTLVSSVLASKRLPTGKELDCHRRWGQSALHCLVVPLGSASVPRRRRIRGRHGRLWTAVHEHRLCA
jgi:diaminopimelate decarboxylase